MSLTVVLDTNVLISATFWQGPPRQLLISILNGKAHLLTSEAILDELGVKLESKKLARYIRMTGRQPQDIVNDFRQIGQVVTPVAVPEDAVRDGKDRIILASAVGGKANFIVSGDKDLTVLNAYAGIPILTPAQFLSILDSGKP